MKFYFTEEDRHTDIRGRDIRAALVHARHEVVRGRPVEHAPAGTDLWLHGIGIEGSPPMTEPVARSLLESEAPFAVFQLCDGPNLSFDRVPRPVLERAQLVLRNHWPATLQDIPECARGKMGALPPMIKPMQPCAGKPLIERAIGSLFFGTRTGFANLPGGKNAREETVRLMRQSGLPFSGGVLPHSDVRYPTDPELLVPRLSARAHARLLQNAKICLVPWGNHPITYRLFEGMARRCLVVAQSLSDTRFIDGGMQAGVHYVEVAPDLADLTQQVAYYLQHLDEAQAIADAGHDHFKRHFASRGGLISEYVFDRTVESWGAVYHPSDRSGPLVAARARAARWFPKKF